MERFTRRAQSDWIHENKDAIPNANFFIKSVVNPRYADSVPNPHHAIFLTNMKLINSDNKTIPYAGICNVVATEKIVINHYYTKSYEEFITKVRRGSAYSGNDKGLELFRIYDRNEVFDDGILKYRAARAENFSFESDEQRINRVINSLVRTLTQSLSEDSPVGKPETFLTCRALAEKFQIKIGGRFAEELALFGIYQTLAVPMTLLEIRQLIKSLPEILSRPFPVCEKIKQRIQNNLLPGFDEILRSKINNCVEHYEINYLQNLLRLIK